MKIGRPSASRLVLALVASAGLAACTTPGGFSADEAATAIAATVSALVTPSVPPTAAAEPPTPEAHTLPTATPPTRPPSLTVVFTDGGNVAVVRDSGPPSVLTSAGRVETVKISDDGAKIAYSRRPVEGDPVELHIINADGTGDVVAMAPADFDALYPLDGALHHDLFLFGFLPGTHQLLLNTRAIFEGPGLAKHDDLIRIDADTLARTMLLAHGTGGDFTPSPDGRYLAITRPDAIEIRTTDGGPSGSGTIAYPPVITYSEYAYYALPVWRPDSAALGSAIPSADPLAPATSGAVWNLPLGGSASPVSTISGQFFLIGGGNASLLSPALDRVAFPRVTTTPNIWTLNLANASGAGEILVATGDITWEGWSPDGAHFVFGLGGPMNLQLGDVTGSFTALTTGTDLRWFSSTGFVYLSGSSGAWTLMRGGIGVPSMPLASPAGSFISYDFAYR